MPTQKIRMNKIKVLSLTHYPGDPESSYVLLAEGPLHLKTAEMLQCSELVFNSQGIIRSWEGKIGLPARIVGASVELGDRVYDAGLVHKFKVRRTEKGDSITPTVELRMHFSGAFVELDGFVRATNQQDFALVIRPNQQILFDDEPDSEDKPAAGEKKEASAAAGE